jgi:hypothetical protein
MKLVIRNCQRVRAIKFENINRHILTSEAEALWTQLRGDTRTSPTRQNLLPQLTGLGAGASLRNVGSMPAGFMLHPWWSQCHLNRFVFNFFAFPLLATIPLLFHTDLIALIRQNIIISAVSCGFMSKPTLGLLCSKKKNSVAFSPQANYTDRATAACWRS